MHAIEIDLSLDTYTHTSHTLLSIYRLIREQLGDQLLGGGFSGWESNFKDIGPSIWFLVLIDSGETQIGDCNGDPFELRVGGDLEGIRWLLSWPFVAPGDS